MLANSWSVSKSLHIPPSAQLHITDPFVAYCLDSAVTRWGSSFEAALQEATRDAKDAQSAERAHDRVIRRWLPSTARYADPRQK